MALKEPLLWQFSHSDLEKRSVRIQATIAVDTTHGMLAAVQNNYGLSVLKENLVGALITGQLVHVHSKWHLPTVEIYVVYPAVRFRPAKLTVIVTMRIEAEKRKASKM